jgi:hypothetical protein
MNDTRSRERGGAERLQKAVTAVTAFPKCMVVLVFWERSSSISLMVWVNFFTVPSVSSANTLFNAVRHLGPRGGGDFVLASSSTARRCSSASGSSRKPRTPTPNAASGTAFGWKINWRSPHEKVPR